MSQPSPDPPSEPDDDGAVERGGRRFSHDVFKSDTDDEQPAAQDSAVKMHCPLCCIPWASESALRSHLYQEAYLIGHKHYDTRKVAPMCEEMKEVFSKYDRTKPYTKCEFCNVQIEAVHVQHHFDYHLNLVQGLPLTMHTMDFQQDQDKCPFTNCKDPSVPHQDLPEHLTEHCVERCAFCVAMYDEGKAEHYKQHYVMFNEAKNHAAGPLMKALDQTLKDKWVELRCKPEWCTHCGLFIMPRDQQWHLRFHLKLTSVSKLAQWNKKFFYPNGDYDTASEICCDFCFLEMPGDVLFHHQLTTHLAPECQKDVACPICYVDFAQISLKAHFCKQYTALDHSMKHSPEDKHLVYRNNIEFAESQFDDTDLEGSIQCGVCPRTVCKNRYKLHLLQHRQTFEKREVQFIPEALASGVEGSMIAHCPLCYCTMPYNQATKAAIEDHLHCHAEGLDNSKLIRCVWCRAVFETQAGYEHHLQKDTTDLVMCNLMRTVNRVKNDEKVSFMEKFFPVDGEVGRLPESLIVCEVCKGECYWSDVEPHVEHHKHMMLKEFRLQYHGDCGTEMVCPFSSTCSQTLSNPKEVLTHCAKEHIPPIGVLRIKWTVVPSNCGICSYKYTSEDCSEQLEHLESAHGLPTSQMCPVEADHFQFAYPLYDRDATMESEAQCRFCPEKVLVANAADHACNRHKLSVRFDPSYLPPLAADKPDLGSDVESDDDSSMGLHLSEESGESSSDEGASSGETPSPVAQLAADSSGETPSPAAQIAADSLFLEAEGASSDESDIPLSAQLPAKFGCAVCEFRAGTKAALVQHQRSQHDRPWLFIEPDCQDQYDHLLSDVQPNMKFLALRLDRQSGNLQLYCKLYEEHLWQLRAQLLSGDIWLADNRKCPKKIKRELWMRECLRYLSEKLVFENFRYVTLDGVVEFPEVTRDHVLNPRIAAKKDPLRSADAPATFEEIRQLPKIDFWGRCTITRTLPDLHRRIEKFSNEELTDRKSCLEADFKRRSDEVGFQAEWANPHFDVPVRWPPNLPMAEEVLGDDGNIVEGKGGAVCDFSHYLVRISKLHVARAKRSGIKRKLREDLPAPEFVDLKSPAAMLNLEGLELQRASLPPGCDSADGIYLLTHTEEERLEPDVAQISIGEIQDVYFGKTPLPGDIPAHAEYLRIKEEHRTGWAKLEHDAKTSLSLADAEAQFWTTTAKRATDAEQGRPILRSAVQNFILPNSSEVYLDPAGSSNLLRFVDPNLALMKTTIGLQHTGLGWQSGLWELPASVFNHGPSEFVAYVISRQHAAKFIEFHEKTAPSTLGTFEDSVQERRSFDALSEAEKEVFRENKAQNREFQRCAFSLLHGNILIDPRVIVEAGIPVRKRLVAPGELLLIQAGAFFQICFAAGTSIVQIAPHLNLETLYYTDITLDYCTCRPESLKFTPAELQRRLDQIKVSIERPPGKLSFPENNVCSLCGAEFLGAQQKAYHIKKFHQNPTMGEIEAKFAPLTLQEWRDSEEGEEMKARADRQLEEEAAKKAEKAARKAQKTQKKAEKKPKLLVKIPKRKKPQRPCTSKRAKRTADEPDSADLGCDQGTSEESKKSGELEGEDE